MGKFEDGDKEKIEKAVQDALDWLDKNQLAEKDEFEAKQKEIEGVVNPIMMKVYQAAGGGGMPDGGMPDFSGGAPPGAGGAGGPTVGGRLEQKSILAAFEQPEIDQRGSASAIEIFSLACAVQPRLLLV